MDPSVKEEYCHNTLIHIAYITIVTNLQ